MSFVLACLLSRALRRADLRARLRPSPAARSAETTAPSPPVVTPPVPSPLGRAAAPSSPPQPAGDPHRLRREIIIAANERMSAMRLVGLVRAVAGAEIGAVDIDRVNETLRRELDELDSDALAEVLCRVEVLA